MSTLQAKCCDDKVHCCPHDMNCDYKQGVCTKDSIKIPILKKTKSTPVKEFVTNLFHIL